MRALLLDGILERPNDTRQYVQLNQIMPVRLLDTLCSYGERKDLNEKILYLYNAISCHLESTLDLIEDFFGNYFDRNVKAPQLIVSLLLKNYPGNWNN